MKLEEIIAISGMPGLYKSVASRSNGVIVEEIPGKKRKFVPARNHQFSPLGSIAIYTEDDAVELKKVFRSMQEKSAELALPDLNGSIDGLRNYFAAILPEYDRDRVHINDMKKVVKWYSFLATHDLLHLLQPEESPESQAPASEA